MGRSEGSGALPSEFFINARHQAVCVSMATRYSRTNYTTLIMNGRSRLVNRRSCQSFNRLGRIRPRELTEQFLRGRLEGMKLLDQYEAACKVRRLVSRTIQTHRRWVSEFLRFHRDRTGRWIHPNEMGESEVEAFLTSRPSMARASAAPSRGSA